MTANDVKYSFLEKIPRMITACSKLYRAVRQQQRSKDLRAHRTVAAVPFTCSALLEGCVHGVHISVRMPSRGGLVTETSPWKYQRLPHFLSLRHSAPRQLVLPFSLAGHHKLWKMDKHTREAAEAGLGPVVNGPSPVKFPSF